MTGTREQDASDASADRRERPAVADDAERGLIASEPADAHRRPLPNGYRAGVITAVTVCLADLVLSRESAG